MPFSFEEFQGKVICDFSSFSSSFSDQTPPSFLGRRKNREEEPNSVLDSLSPLTTSSSTVSSSNGGNSIAGGGISVSGGGDVTTTTGLGGDWELPPSSSSPTHDHDHDHDQSILRLIMGDGDSTDPSLELNNILQTPSPVFHDSGYHNNSSFGIVDTGFGLDNPPPPPLLQTQPVPPHHVLINQSQTHFTQNQTIFYNQQPIPPPAKRLNSGVGPTITEQLSKLAEVIDNEDTCLAQTILARLNQQLSTPTKPFERAAFYFKEALHNLLLHQQQNATTSPYSLVFKIAAYKSFSEISPVLQFANFTSNQALLESFYGFRNFHIIDFDLGFGGQWASLMQELVNNNNNNNNGEFNDSLSVKLTVFTSHHHDHDHDHLGFTQENLKHFASEINISLQIQVLRLDLIGSIIWPPPSKQEAIAVNLSTTSFSPLVLRFVKHLSPTIVVCSDNRGGCERTDLPFSQRIIHSLHSQTALLESLDAVNATLDVMNKIERFLIQPEIEKLVVADHRRRRSMMVTMTWQAMLLQMGFLPVTHSNFTESQAECLVQRTPVRGFHVEKKQNSLLLCWQRRELVGVSAWKSPSSSS